MTDRQHTLATYLSDMLALEEHIRIPFDAQLRDGDLPKYAPADALLRRLSEVSNIHVQTLKAALENYGGHEAHPAKSAVVSVEGWFASAIDKMRKTKIAKALRDDYTALSLCCVSYGMLLTTANGLNAPDVAQLAERHLGDYAQMVMEIGGAIPAVVLEDLSETGVEVSQTPAAQSREQIERAWRAGATASHLSSETGTIENDAALNRASTTYPTV